MNRRSLYLSPFVCTNRVNMCGVLSLVVVMLSANTIVSSAGESVGVPPEEAVSQPRRFAAGVQIDWQRRAVEVDASVVLREGPLELLACSPHTREHESILAVRARPLHIYQAMGLIGLEPGSPVRYDPKHQRVHPATGQPLALRIRFPGDGRQQVIPAEQWLYDIKRKQTPTLLDWVFAGSHTRDDGRFTADLEGTVACVVDFSTALIALRASHSADNDLLWLAANTEAIPPIGTKCTLLISAAPGQTRGIVLDLAVDGSLRQGDKAIPATDVLRMLHREEPGTAAVRVVLRAGANISNKGVETAVASLVAAGVNRSLIEIQRER
ncbi:MAG: hypothetical protein JSU63_20425 [Phycisphaerales bacterium]|nr:MAG: hypothetical protein JSU63_20425 [Phycisphaerales bacterium]